MITESVIFNVIWGLIFLEINGVSIKNILELERFPGKKNLSTNIISIASKSDQEKRKLWPNQSPF